MSEDQAQSTFLDAFQTAFIDTPLQFQQQFEMDAHTFWVRSNSKPTLKMLTEALQHLASSSKSNKPELYIEVWTTTNNSRVNKFISWLNETYSQQVVRVQTSRFSFFYNPGFDGGYSSLNFIDFERQRAIFWVKDGTTIPWYELAAPFRVIFHWFFQTQNYYLIHAAAIGMADKGILLVGKGGSGKSTTALTTFEHNELLYLGDDYTLIKLTPHPTVFCLYSSAKVTDDTLKRFQQLRGAAFQITQADQEKKTLFFSKSKLGQLKRSLPLVAILLPSICNTKATKLATATRAEALLALAPSTIFQLLPEDNQTTSFIELSLLVQKLRAYHLLLGTNPTEIAQKIYSKLLTL